MPTTTNLFHKGDVDANHEVEKDAERRASHP